MLAAGRRQNVDGFFDSVKHQGVQAVVDGSISDDPFLPDYPKELMASGIYNDDVKILLGTNR